MRTLIGIVLVVAVAAGLAGIGTHIYNLGVAQGIAQAGKLPSPGPGAGPYPVYPYPFYPYGGPFHGFGFGFFGLLWMVLLIFLLFAVLRRAYWGGRPWGGSYGRGAPRWFEEWHRQAHEPKSTGGTV
jgi:hypothetical protein